MTEYECMTPDELAEWRLAATNPRARASAPCVDCPIAYHLAEKAAGRCDREWPVKYGAPRRFSEDELLERRRQSWRESKVRKRLAARARAWDNAPSGRSAEPNSMASDARLSATTREAGVVASIEVVAR